MSFEDMLYGIKAEFMDELDKRKKLLDKIARLQEENEQLYRDLAAYQSVYSMKNEICRLCEFEDECIDANRVDGKKLCASFHAHYVGE